MKNIVLVGFMGTGKTEISKILALRLRRQRLCIDDMIEWKVGKPILRIFEEDGEAYFRKVESETVKAVSKDKNIVIDAGGGIVMDEHNVRRLKEHGVLICLSARPEVILERTKNYVHRPLLDDKNPLDRIKILLNERARYYECADYAIDTSDITQDEVVEKIIEVVEKIKSKGAKHLILS